MKNTLATYMFMLVCGTVLTLAPTHAGNNRVTFGLECGYAASIVNLEQSNFFDPDEYNRVNINDWRLTCKFSGELLLHAGYDFNEHWNLSLYAGYAGAGEYQPAIPIFLRLSRYYGNSTMKDRWFTFLDAGSGIGIKPDPQEIYIGRLGGGYRLSMSRLAKLDLMASVRFMCIHPQIIHYGEMITADLINRNNAYITSINIGIGLTF
jgi:hypothetical protein